MDHVCSTQNFNFKMEYENDISKIQSLYIFRNIQRSVID